jgi:hypothetical protein
MCDEFPCDKVSGLLCSREGLLVFVHKRLATITEDDYNLCLRQFESMPNLIQMMAKAGKLPAWTAGDSPEQ